MYGIVKIGESEVPMLSLASVDVYYQHIFHEDPIKLQSEMGDDIGIMITFFQKMGFVMARYAELKERKEVLKLTFENYIDWLDTYERNELIEALPDIRAVYEGQMVTSTAAKKNTEA